MFSLRSGRSRAPNALAELMAKSPPPRFDLCGTNPTRAGIVPSPALVRALALAVAAPRAYAPEPLGIFTARQAVARHVAATRALAEAPAAEDVVLTASTSEAYAFLFKLLCDPDDEVLVPAPSYPLFEHLTELEAVRAASYRLAYDGAWHIDFDSVRRAISARTRAIIVVSPNNPSAQYVTDAERTALEALGLPIVSDEVFFEYPLLPGAHVARRGGQQAPSSLTFALGGLSKLVGAP